MARMEIITELEPRRSWSEKQKRAIVDAAFPPGAIVAYVTRCAAVVPGRSIGADRSCATPVTGFPK
jgi:transposase